MTVQKFRVYLHDVPYSYNGSTNSSLHHLAQPASNFDYLLTRLKQNFDLRMSLEYVTFHSEVHPEENCYEKSAIFRVSCEKLRDDKLTKIFRECVDELGFRGEKLPTTSLA